MCSAILVSLRLVMSPSANTRSSPANESPPRPPDTPVRVETAGEMVAQVFGIGASADAPENNVVIDELAAGGAGLAWFDRYAVPRRRALDPFTRQQHRAALPQEFSRVDGRRLFGTSQNARAGFNDGHGSSRPSLDDLARHLAADRAAADNQDFPRRRERRREPMEHRLALVDRAAQRADQFSCEPAAGREHADVARHHPSSAITAVHQATSGGQLRKAPLDVLHLRQA